MKHFDPEYHLHYLKFMKQKIFDRFMRVTESFITILKMLLIDFHTSAFFMLLILFFNWIDGEKEDSHRDY